MRHPDDGLIEEYLDGELAAEGRGGLEAHAAGCDACRERIEAARATRSEADGLVALLGEPAPRPGTGDLPASLRPPVRRPLRWRTLAWAASVMMAAGLGYVGGTTGRRGDAATERAAVGGSESRAVGQSSSPVATQAPTEPAEHAPSGRPTAGPPDRPAARPTDAAAEPPVVRLENAAPLAKQRVDGELARPLESREEVRLADADRAAGRMQPANQPASPAAASLDDAVRALGGSIRLVDGLEVQRVEVAWLPMPGGDSAAVVELTYADAAGRPIVLRQSRTVAAVGQFAAADAAQAKAGAPARALAAEPPSRRAAEPPRDGELTWVDGGGFRLVLHADADADSLARLRARVR
jgi:hypothetical protein